MECLFAPMEGITYAVYRTVHFRLFPGMSEYYTPFIAPEREGTFKPKFLKELTRGEPGMKLVPQLLVNQADPFVTTARKLQDLGFGEINLNLGCPSGTVFAKHKGAGMLTDLPELDALLDSVYTRTEPIGLKVSIKTRMGVHSTEEFSSILEIYKKYPVSRLIIHARDRDGQYLSTPDKKGFAEARNSCSFPVCYNGNIFSAEDLTEMQQLTGGKLNSVMLGRGILANPALGRQLSGGTPLTAEELQQFHDTLLDAWLEEGLSPVFTVQRMKQLWYYMIHMYTDYKKEQKAILKSGSLPEYRTAVRALFLSGKFDPDGRFRGH